MLLKVYTDASPSKAVIGVGVKIIGSKINLEIGVPIKPGLSTAEAEMYAFLIGVDLVRSIVGGLGLKRKAAVEFYLDSNPVIKFLYDMQEMKAASTNALKIQTLKALQDASKVMSWKVQSTRAKTNPADRLAKSARQRWSTVWKAKEKREPSGRS